MRRGHRVERLRPAFRRDRNAERVAEAQRAAKRLEDLLDNRVVDLKEIRYHLDLIKRALT